MEDIDIDDFGVRFKVTYPKGRRTRNRLCSGKDNTCEKLARKENAGYQCNGCARGNPKVKDVIYEKGTIYRNNNGVRVKVSKDGTSRLTCIGKDDTCPNYAVGAGLCDTCKKNS